MPLIHVYMNEGKSQKYKDGVSDALLKQQTALSMHHVFGPKAGGAISLHRVLHCDQHDQTLQPREG